MQFLRKRLLPKISYVAFCIKATVRTVHKYTNRYITVAEG